METGYKVGPVVRQPSPEAAAATHETAAPGSASCVLTCQKVKFDAPQSPEICRCSHRVDTPAHPV